MTIDELIKAANEYRKRYDITYSEGVILPLSSIMADFAAECVKDALALADAADNYCDRCGDIVQVNAIERAIRAERERADKLHAALVEIEQSYLAHGTDCSSCYDLFTIAVLAQEAK